MAKGCDCKFILDAVETDPALRCLPLAVRMLWLVLVRQMQRHGSSVLMFGSDIPKPSEIAMLATCTETELETQLQPLLARGLLVRREDGVLESPLLAARVKRAETARINGLKGGRPRKDGTAARQREMLMVVPGGGAAASAKTQEEPAAATVGSPAKLAKASLEEEAKLAEAPADWQRVADAAMEAAGFDPVRWTGHCGLVLTWLQLGASEALILATIRRVMARGSARPAHFGYFDRAVREALAAERVEPEAPASSPESAARARAYIAAMEAWRNCGMIGQPPVLEVA